MWYAGPDTTLDYLGAKISLWRGVDMQDVKARIFAPEGQETCPKIAPKGRANLLPSAALPFLLSPR